MAITARQLLLSFLLICMCLRCANWQLKDCRQRGRAAHSRGGDSAAPHHIAKPHSPLPWQNLTTYTRRRR
ncbi:uncharacterized protein EI97DRAFT_437384 [Westerdykella ornata]|uniref:Secreted protein n=1 Tax=Westerdykella ornata TaxID=318751 RepID=A0A6A6J7B2_WESOR|nr:uncharacterized protein EI97DRAFT_437384 [Westerdykella ornata]KAF2271898.1 hypothetical protein EI97DRAFT_437384 [Westerdykella ornata]